LKNLSVITLCQEGFSAWFCFKNH